MKVSDVALLLVLFFSCLGLMLFVASFFTIGLKLTMLAAMCVLVASIAHIFVESDENNG